MLVRRRSWKYLRSTRSMKGDRDCFDPARRSTLAKRSFDSVKEVFSFILLLCHFRLCFSLQLVGTNSPKNRRALQKVKRSPVRPQPSRPILRSIVKSGSPRPAQLRQLSSFQVETATPPCTVL